jgi:transposase
MTLLPPGVKVHLALGYIDMRKGIDGLAMLVQGVLRQDPFSGAPVRVPRPLPGQPDQDRVLGRDRIVSVHQAARARCLPLASERRSGRDPVVDLDAAVAADRGRRLARTGAAMATGNSGLIDAAD